ncbi:hypothetical protein NBG4_250036 [Candidatus Sulfobium mesophilum]|uniref:Uncharacterized protein n=1 Tax=Candidatus Sulfobium mesophilum TaxID=2016548 RepID=A0A2U3QGF7_9BACT|nr:hypothetical protein NBG4_250036 [Candidatus Sulfobium mesophilum]
MRLSATESIADGEKVLTVSQVDEVNFLLRKVSALSDVLNAASEAERTTDIMEELDKIRAILTV